MILNVLLDIPQDKIGHIIAAAGGTWHTLMDEDL